MSPAIGIVLGSYSDVQRMKAGLDRLTAMDVPFEMRIASAHRTPGPLEAWLEGAQRRGVRVIIAGAGAAAHLPGVVASKVLLPVIGVPFDASPLGGVDALHSIVQMPPGIPVATVGIDGAENAVLLALHILALSDEDIRKKLEAFRDGWKAKIAEQNRKLYAEIPQAKPAEEAESPAEPDEAAPAPVEAPEVIKKKEPKEGKLRPCAGKVWKIDPHAPELEAVEEAVDALLDGGVIALPTDTVYGLAADATNPSAVAKLFELKKREPAKPIAVLIDSLNLFRSLIAEVPEGVLELIENHWPGPLTIVARKRGAALQAVSPGQSLGLRMPDNMTALGVINMLGRPIAVTSANTAGEPPFATAEEIVAYFVDRLDMALDAGPASGAAHSTVLTVMEKPYRILREGPIAYAVLKQVLGDLLE